MARRLPSQPPTLSGFSHLHVLGSGGFADVFLYEQNLPRRLVAVKVLLSEVVNDQVRQMFQAEANLMAQLSSHPAILTVYQASVSADGRPYLVMELCSSSLSDRYRRERIPVPEVLRVAIKIGGAIETAHRSGVLHRDIKPSNILLTAYGHPVLSDFGIASTINNLDSQESVGLSIPWSAPEVLVEETTGTVQSEVWSFAATVYSLLAGRSPFEVREGSNSSNDLMTRINKAVMQPIERPDVPLSLERALQFAMSRRPDDRPSSVFDLVRELQAVESQLGVPQTSVDVEVDDWALSTLSDSDDKTVIRALREATWPSGDRRRRREATLDSVGSIDQALLQARMPRMKRPRGFRRIVPWLIAAMTAAVLIVCVATGAFTHVWASAGSTSQPIPTVTNIGVVQSAGSLTFTWNNPGLTSSDSYQLTVTQGNNGQSVSVQQQRAFVVSGLAGDQACIAIAVNRSGVVGASSRQKCAEIT